MEKGLHMHVSPGEGEQAELASLPWHYFLSSTKLTPAFSRTGEAVKTSRSPLDLPLLSSSTCPLPSRLQIALPCVLAHAEGKDLQALP